MATLVEGWTAGFPTRPWRRMEPHAKRQKTKTRTFKRFKKAFPEDYQKYLFFAVGLALDTPILEALAAGRVFDGECKLQRFFYNEMVLHAFECGYELKDNIWSKGKHTFEITVKDGIFLLHIARDFFTWEQGGKFTGELYNYKRRLHKTVSYDSAAFRSLVGPWKIKHRLPSTSIVGRRDSRGPATFLGDWRRTASLPVTVARRGRRSSCTAGVADPRRKAGGRLLECPGGPSRRASRRGRGPV